MYTVLRPGGKMLELILAGLGGLFLGSTIVLGIQAGTAPAPAPPQEEIAKEQQEIIKQLTDLDMVKEICTKELTLENRLLCRELTCHVYSRGIDSKTTDCEEIQNIANTVSMDTWCNQYTDIEVKADCIELFSKRK
jgi:hypothetical protein